MNNFTSSKSKSMTTEINLQQILTLSASIAVEQYPDQVNALRVTIPRRLQTLINMSERATFSRRIRNVVEENIIASYKETLMEIENFNNRGEISGAAELINWFRCETEMARLFFEGLYRYVSGYDN
jgi:hypothetical protein